MIQNNLNMEKKEHIMLVKRCLRSTVARLDAVGVTITSAEKMNKQRNERRNMNRQYKATVIFQEIGGTNKVRIVSKKISKETMDKLSSYLFREMIVEEPIRQNLSDLKEQLDLAEQQIKDQIADDEAHDAQ